MTPVGSILDDQTSPIGHIPSEVRESFPDYDARRYDDLNLPEIVDGLRGTAMQLLKRGTLAVLIARREFGGLLVAASKKITEYRNQVDLFRRVGVDYSDARRMMKIWVHWGRIEQMLRDREQSAQHRGIPYITPGYRRCLKMAGITRTSARCCGKPPAPIVPEPLPGDVERLQTIVKDLRRENRLEREISVGLRVDLYLARDELSGLAFNHGQPLPVDDHTAAIISQSNSWLTRRPPALPLPERETHTEVRIGNCLDRIDNDPDIYDALATDGPYAIGLHGHAWDNDISFRPALWQRLMRVMKPGAYGAFFTASRLYHRAAQAAEDAGFVVMPFLAWRFCEGLPKPVNVSELFDRDNVRERKIIGVRRGSGFTQANAARGLQIRTDNVFTAFERYVSEEAQIWRGYFSGVNALKPRMEPILLVQKPIATSRLIDNLRLWGTGALNVGALKDRYGFWPGTLLTHRKANKAEHQTDHPTVKPLSLMEDLCSLLCPAGGRILDPFAGTGTTGVAAKRRGFDCVLIEQDANMAAVIDERLRRMS
jgi:site-specific DNA-methyltransferase (adenine-specific)